jgi:hypothetical protein
MCPGMLKNIPTAEVMEQVSLRLYFTAWEHVLNVIAEMKEIDRDNTVFDDLTQKYGSAVEATFNDPAHSSGTCSRVFS